MRLGFSPESQLDLMEIAAFIAQDNPARAKSFVDELEADCGRLSSPFSRVSVRHVLS